VIKWRLDVFLMHFKSVVQNLRIAGIPGVSGSVQGIWIDQQTFTAMTLCQVCLENYW